MSVAPGLWRAGDPQRAPEVDFSVRPYGVVWRKGWELKLDMKAKAPADSPSKT